MKDELTADTQKNFKHGSTQISTIGSFSKDEKKVLICVVNNHQIVDFKKILEKYDNTFSFFETVNEICGNFVKIK